MQTIREVRIPSNPQVRIAVLLAILGQAAPAQSPFPAPGRFADLGGHRLHVWCTGKGSPIVIVENGLGDFSFDWILVQQRVARFARICTYDRAGYAWSEPGPKPRTFDQLNLELHDALRRLGERGPFVLVGHSFGGGVVRNYASVYPDEVAGMVLVDIVPEDQRIPMGPNVARIRDFATGRAIPKPRENLLPSDRTTPPPTAALTAKIEPPYDRLPEREQKLHLWAASLPALDDAENSQKDWSSEYMARMHATPQDGILGTKPLVVLTRTRGYDDPELEAERQTRQAQLVRLSRQSKQILVPGGHNMHLETPDAVADAIRIVIELTRLH